MPRKRDHRHVCDIGIGKGEFAQALWFSFDREMRARRKVAAFMIWLSAVSADSAS